ncbi:MAG: type II toxin-antitoxin system VapC family toxin [Spirochaetaceae bacterium]
MIAIDTNILVYSHREDSAFHVPAFSAVKNLAESGSLWAIPWPAIHEFLAIVTHPRIYSPPSPLSHALLQVRSWMDCPTFTAIGEYGEPYFHYLEHVLNSSQARGPKVHDARIAALCLTHGVDELWSADRNFSRFPGLQVKNPLV